MTASSRGNTLVELLALAAILGMMVVALAPVESFLARAWGAARRERAAQVELEQAAGRLERDVRGARALEMGDATGATGGWRVRAAGGPVVWSWGDAGVERRAAESVRRFPTVRSARSVRRAGDFAELELVGRDGTRRRIAVRLRNALSRPDVSSQVAP